MGLLTGTGRGAQLGILIKGPQVMEDTRTVDTIVLDKTGTATTGKLSVTDVTTLGPLPEEDVLALAGGLETASEHPIAETIWLCQPQMAPLRRPDLAPLELTSTYPR